MRTSLSISITRSRKRLAASTGMIVQHVADLGADSEHRIELAARIGDHHRKRVATQLAKPFRFEPHQILAIEAHLSPRDPARRRHELHDRASERGFSRPRFADESDDLLWVDGEVEPAHRPHRRQVVARELDVETLDLQNRFRHHRVLGSMTKYSRSTSR